jgi:hypothetical protein
MRIEIKKFGDILTSRPAGKEACLVIKSYMKPENESELIELDFSGVHVMTPSWLDEVLTGLKEEYGDRVSCLATDNQTVIESLKVLKP